MSNSHRSSSAVFPLLDSILGNKSITSNFVTTSARADMIERESHSCRVILFPNLFFIIPERQPVSSDREDGRRWCRICSLHRPWTRKVTAGTFLSRQCWLEAGVSPPRQEWLGYLCPGQHCQASKQNIHDQVRWVYRMCSDLLWKKNINPYILGTQIPMHHCSQQHHSQQPEGISNRIVHQHRNRWTKYTEEYYWALKRHGALRHATAWMNLGNLMLSEIRRTRKDIYCMILVT